MIGLGWYAGRQSMQVAAPAFDRMIRVVSTPAHEFGPAISPDGKWIAYLSNSRGPTDVWVKFIAGGEPANLTASAGIDVQSQDYIGGLDVSPDGRLIAFTAGKPGAETPDMSTWVIPAPLGGVPRKLLNEPDQGLRWSPDMKRISYMRPGGSAGDGLLVADADGQNERELIKPEGGRHIHWLRWSSDGHYIYFNYGIHNFNTEPAQIGRVLAAGGSLDTISWSPDGRQLVYAVSRGEAPGLVIVSVIDGAVARLSTPAAAHAPAWSPRGDVIAYLKPRLGLGTRLRFVNSHGQPVYERLPEVPQQLGNGFLAWSPYGQRLAAVGLPGSRAGHIWIIEPDGSTPIRRLIDLPAGDYLRGITWTCDGAALVMGRIRWTGDIVLAERSR
jgi:WD40-like Beta Propeller Repeat